MIKNVLCHTSMGFTRECMLNLLDYNNLDKFEKNKDMQDNLKKFREEAQKLEESEALKECCQHHVFLRLWTCPLSFIKSI